MSQELTNSHVSFCWTVVEEGRVGCSAFLCSRFRDPRWTGNCCSLNVHSATVNSENQDGPKMKDAAASEPPNKYIQGFCESPPSSNPSAWFCLTVQQPHWTQIGFRAASHPFTTCIHVSTPALKLQVNQSRPRIGSSGAL